MKLIVLLSLVLVACGTSTQDDEPEPVSKLSWVGGVVGVWPAERPKAILILHQGHDCFSGCGYPSNLVPAAEQFAKAGFIVYGMEMPLHEHLDPAIEPLTWEQMYRPVADLLDTFDGTLPVYIAGLSGGGFIATLTTALDSRIVKGYSVDGDEAWSELYLQADVRLTHIFVPGSFLKLDCGRWEHPYPCANDMTVSQHAMSAWAVEYIISDVL